MGQDETGRGLGVASSRGLTEDTARAVETLRGPRRCPREMAWDRRPGPVCSTSEEIAPGFISSKALKKASGPCRKSAFPRRAGCPPKCPGFTPALHRASPHGEIRLLGPAPALALLSPDAGPANQVSIAPATARSMESRLLPKRSAQRCGQCRAMPGLCPYVQVRNASVHKN